MGKELLSFQFPSSLLETKVYFPRLAFTEKSHRSTIGFLNLGSLRGPGTEVLDCLKIPTSVGFVRKMLATWDEKIQERSSFFKVHPTYHYVNGGEFSIFPRGIVVWSGLLSLLPRLVYLTISNF